jgi:endoglycosylceramidase
MEITALADVCDEFLSGWAYWQLKNFADLTTSAGTGSEGFYNNDGTLQEGKVKALTRTYLTSTQGILSSMQFSSETSNFEARFKLNTDIKAPSVLYYNKKYYYNQGLDIVLHNV